MYEKYKIEPKDAGRKRLYEQFSERLNYLESNLSASVNFSRDRNDANHRFNKLRDKLIRRGVI